MNKLEKLQLYADKVATKLGIADCKPILRWSGGECRTKPSQAAHCHTGSNNMPRGTICLSRVAATVREWRYTITHEVAHLATKQSHSSYAFALRMEQVGQVGRRERNAIRSHRKHQHLYSIMIMDGEQKRFLCHYCRKERKEGGKREHR